MSGNVPMSFARRRALHRALHQLLLGLSLAGVLFLSARMYLGADTWWHLRTGEWIWVHQRLPETDVFSYTRFGTPWSPPGWPVQVLFYLLVRTAGYGALNLWTAFMVLLTYGIVAQTMRGGPYLRALALILAALTGSLYQAARPYMVTTLFTAGFLWALETWYRGMGHKRLFLLVALMVLWGNVHAGFLAGFLVWGCYWLAAWFEAWKHPSTRARRRVRTLLGLGLGLVLASWLNPQGPALWFYPWKTLRLEGLRWIQEWQAPDFTQPETWPLLVWWFLMLLVLGTGAPAWRWRHGLLWMVFGLMAFRAVRNIALFAVVAPVVWSAYARPWWSRKRKQFARLWNVWASSMDFSRGPLRSWFTASPPPVRSRLNWALMLLAWGLALLRLYQVSAPTAIEAHLVRTFPEAPVAYLKAMHPPGRLFNSYNWGGYLLWTLPEYPVFIDGRTDLYGDVYLRLWAQVATAEPGWEQVLDEYQVGIVLLEPHWPLTKVLAYRGWREVYRDPQSVLFLRPRSGPSFPSR